MAHRPPGLRAPSTRPTGTPAWRVRLVILAAALAPLSIWPLATGRLARPLETAAWALLCGLLAASAPGHWARLGAYAQALLLPLTLVWIGAVAGTGMGPSLNTLGSVAAGAYREVWNGVVLAFGAPGFAPAAAATLLLTVWATRLAHRHRWQAGGPSGLLFLLLLLPASATVLDAAGLHTFARLAGPEARMAVPWLSHLEMMKAGLEGLAVDRRTG